MILQASVRERPVQLAEAARRGAAEDHYSLMSIGQLRHLKRGLDTGLGLAMPRSPSRAALEQQLIPVEAELDRRRWYESVFPAHTDQAANVRAAVARFLDLCGFPQAEDAILVVNELAANAITHSRSRYTGTFTVRAELFPGRHLWVEVEDAGGDWSPVPAQVVPADISATDGRGLCIVDCLSAGNWGVQKQPSGCVVWAKLPLTNFASLQAAGAAARFPGPLTPQDN